MASLPEDPGSWVTCLVLVTPWHSYWGARECAKVGLREELDWTYRW
jgi:hypothetical protein